MKQSFHETIVPSTVGPDELRALAERATLVADASSLTSMVDFPIFSSMHPSVSY
jgi:hypothetical protein